MKVTKLDNKKLNEEELRSNQNMHKPEDVHIHADIPYGVARDEDTAAQEHAEEVYDALEKDASSVTPKDPDTGNVKIPKNMYAEKIALDESLFTEDADDDNEIANFLKDSVEWLIEQDEGCSTYKLNDRLGICVGWQDGYDPEDELAIHSATSPQYAIVAGIKVYTSDDMRTDYDWINYPYFANGEVIDDSVTIEPTENYDKLARYFSKEFDAMKDWEIEEDGLVIKSDDGEEDAVEESCKGKRRSKKLKESRKQLNEGPGAGYTITATTSCDKINSIAFVDCSEVGSGGYVDVECDCDIDATTTDIKAEGAYDGTSRDFAKEEIPSKITGATLNVNIDSIIDELGIEVGEDEDTWNKSKEEILSMLNNNIEALKESIFDAFVGIETDIVYGGGWSHSTYDGTITDGDIDSSSDYSIFELYSAAIQLTDKKAIEYIDKAVTGDNQQEVFYVVIDGVWEEGFTDEAEAIEYARSHDGERVVHTYEIEDYDGNIDFSDYEEVVWEEDDWEDDDVEESLSPKHRRKVRESKKHNLEPRKRTAPDGKVWWVAYDTDSKKYSTITTIGKYENKKDCQYAIDKYNKLNESKSLKEKKGEVEDLPDNVYQLVYDALFLGNKNFRPHIADEAGEVYDWEQSLIMLPGYNDYDLGIALEKEEDGKYAKAVADKLGLKYEIKPTSSLSDGYKFIATVRIPDDIANKDATEYVTSIGLDMNTIRPKKTKKK